MAVVVEVCCVAWVDWLLNGLDCGMHALFARALWAATNWFSPSVAARHSHFPFRIELGVKKNSVTPPVPFSIPWRRCSQEAAKPDPDARWRAEQPELERSYLFVFRPLLGMPYRSLRCVSVFAFISHVSVATVVSLYEG